MTEIHIEGRLGISCNESPYFFPNTIRECRRLDLQQLILQRFFKRNYFAPIWQAQQPVTPSTGSWNDQILQRIVQQQRAEDPAVPKRVLDIGCGTGLWGMEIAEQFTDAQVVGLDIVSPARSFPQPLPARFTFMEANILHGLPMFADGSFDFVHMRCVGMGIPEAKWQAVIDELTRVTVPGGWIETVEARVPFGGGPAFTEIHAMIEQILVARGIDIGATRRIDEYLRRATFPVQAISSYEMDVPIGTAGRSHGIRMSWNILLELDNLAPLFIQGRCWDDARWKLLRQQVEAELGQDEYQPSVPVSIALGQRQ